MITGSSLVHLKGRCIILTITTSVLKNVYFLPVQRAEATPPKELYSAERIENPMAISDDGLNKSKSMKYIFIGPTKVPTISQELLSFV